MKKHFIIFLLTLLISGCSFVDPITQAQAHAQKGKFEDAIKVLQKEYKKKPNSVPLKSLLAQMYSDYGLALCQNTDKPPKIKYTLAKEQFAMALELNPYLQDAKEMYNTIEKIQASFAANKVE
jgi:tetratricopeptide (TPR) repeat protein